MDRGQFHRVPDQLRGERVFLEIRRQEGDGLREAALILRELLFLPDHKAAEREALSERGHPSRAALTPPTRRPCRPSGPPAYYVSHGDIHTNNILCGVSHRNLILIDCRGKSSAGLPYFDPGLRYREAFP